MKLSYGVAGALLIASSLSAQRPDRSTDLRDRGRAVERAATGPQMVNLIAEEAKPRYAIVFQPQAVTSDGEDQVGAMLAFKNESLLKVPFQLAVRDRVVMMDPDVTENLFQVDGYASLWAGQAGRFPIELIAQGVYRTKSKMNRLMEAAGEIDFTFYNNDDSKTSWVVAPVLYYDNLKPEGATEAFTGTTVGVLTQFALKALRFEAEYDLDSEFAGEDFAMAQVGYVLRRGRTTVTPTASIEKHGTYRFGVKFNMPERLDRATPGQR